MAFIDKFDPPDEEEVGAVQWLVQKGITGYWLDVTVQLQTAEGTVVLGTLGDNKTYKTLEEAEKVVREEVGVEVVRLPEPNTRKKWSCAAFFIGELAPVDRPTEQIFAESGLPARNADYSRKTD